VVHLATHGFVNPSEPTSSGIVLCPDGEGTEDGYFQTLEVMALPMDVGLVVLSACESGRGQIGRGEGVVGLSRAFLASGTRAIVASLWPVSDESTARLMEEFYGRMFGKRQPAADALNGACLVLIDDPRHSHPFHWSSFVVIGLEDSPW
jgi:CHAT domain-containing protein